ncbi:MAG: M23 family metallopeptidase [Lentisphaerae bacterium]|nr:M23 family metallopeptidase [Lentisphaerota bacterium]
MADYQFNEPIPQPAWWRFLRRHWFWLLPLLIFDLALLTFYLRRKTATHPAPAQTGNVAQPDQPAVRWPPSDLRNLGFPTDQTNLLAPEAVSVFQPTASGNPESALYGSVRTRKQGRSFLPAFHEGLDIAAMQRDRQGRPLDRIYAVAPGKIGYINRIAGNSNYGRYLVLVHDDPLGEVYTLYSHLAQVDDGLQAGHNVAQGQVLGIMGNSSSSPIPMVRAHLHFEIGIVLNDRFGNWFASKKLKPNHGRFHGWNLLGIDPLAVYADQGRTPGFNLLRHLQSIPPAYDLIIRTDRLPDYFRRYQSLWQGEAFVPGAIVVTCTEGGVPLSGRNAKAQEADLPGRDSAKPQNVDEKALGRNGLRIITRQGDQWQLGRNGLRWLEMLLYH